MMFFVTIEHIFFQKLSMAQFCTSVNKGLVCRGFSPRETEETLKPNHLDTHVRFSGNLPAGLGPWLTNCSKFVVLFGGFSVPGFRFPETGKPAKTSGNPEFFFCDLLMPSTDKCVLTRNGPMPVGPSQIVEM